MHSRVELDGSDIRFTNGTGMVYPVPRALVSSIRQVGDVVVVEWMEENNKHSVHVQCLTEDAASRGMVLLQEDIQMPPLSVSFEMMELDFTCPQCHMDFHSNAIVPLPARTCRRSTSDESSLKARVKKHMRESHGEMKFEPNLQRTYSTSAGPCPMKEKRNRTRRVKGYTEKVVLLERLIVCLDDESDTKTIEAAVTEVAKLRGCSSLKEAWKDCLQANTLASKTEFVDKVAYEMQRFRFQIQYWGLNDNSASIDQDALIVDSFLV